jgi:RNA polymerase sigma-70 factor (ECF subfamily)
VTGDPAEAEDVLQTVFLRLARRPQPLGPTDYAGAYLHRAAVNGALDVVRARRARRMIPVDEAPGGEILDGAPRADADQYGRELRSILREALGRLHPRSAEMFVLRHFEGLGNREIADALGTSPGTVAVTLHRARARLRDEIRPYLGGT